MTDLLDLMRAPPVVRPVDPDGPVVQGDPDEELRLPHPRMAWDLACIQLHRHEDGSWMWAVRTAGGGYKVGAKWGKFAATRGDALHHAVRELEARLERIRSPEIVGVTKAQLASIRRWAGRLT